GVQFLDGPRRREAAFCHNLFVCRVRNITVGTQLINQRELSWTLRTFVKRPRPADDGQKRCRGTTLNGSLLELHDDLLACAVRLERVTKPGARRKGIQRARRQRGQ